MKRYTEKELKILNQQLKGIGPEEIIQWAQTTTFVENRLMSPLAPKKVPGF